MSTETLINTISRRSDRYGDKLVDFMERYGLPCLACATEEQLKDYIKTEIEEVTQ